MSPGLDTSWIDRSEYPWSPLARETEAGRQAYVDEGRVSGREVVLFVHGTPCWSYDWRHLIKALAPRYRCIAPDHIGFGQSARPADWGYGLEDHRRNLREILRQASVDRFHLVVHDFGGPIALPLALETPERVLSLTLINTWLWDMGAHDPEFARIAARMDSPLMRFLYLRCNFSARFMVRYAWGKRRPLDRETHAPFIRMFPTRTSRLGAWAFARSFVEEKAETARWEAQLATLRSLRTLLVWGMADRAIKTVQLERWRKELPEARVLELPGVGHWPHEEAPDEVARALHAHLGSMRRAHH